MSMAVEIICTQCGAEAFLKREPIYTGFTKSGEILSCSACGAVFGAESEVPFKEYGNTPAIFTEADRPEKIEIFDADESICFCRYCSEYVMNPFMQYCSRHRKEVQATDTCPDFSPSKKSGSI